MRPSLFFVFVFFSAVAIAQPFKINFAAGFANYSGDIQQKNFTLQQSQGAFGIGVSYELNDHFAIRSDLNFAKVAGDDKYSKNMDTKPRNLNFKSNITEFSVAAEYSLLSLDRFRLSRYIFPGVSVYHFNPYTSDQPGNKTFLQPLSTEGQGLKEYTDRKVYKRTQLNVPVGGGIKYGISEDITLGVELGFRYIFTDYLDDVSTRYVNEAVLGASKGPKAIELAFRGDEAKTNPIAFQENGQRGNPKYNDYYYFGQVRLGIRLNWFEGYSAGTRRYGCPSRVW